MNARKRTKGSAMVKTGKRRGRTLEDLGANVTGKIALDIRNASPDVVDVIAFGSYARGDATSTSDLDLCVVAKDGVSAEEKKAIAGQADLATVWTFLEHGFSRDVLCFTREDLQKNGARVGTVESEILRDGVVLGG